ncbi:MAG: hypothetical protein QM535_19225 [Limnohabitans sp.]|nr:hypothetical protein [Limnohabitans sp.]
MKKNIVEFWKKVDEKGADFDKLNDYLQSVGVIGQSFFNTPDYHYHITKFGTENGFGFSENESKAYINKEPLIVEFYISPPEVSPAMKVKLSWKLLHATNCQIEGLRSFTFVMNEQHVSEGEVEIEPLWELWEKEKKYILKIETQQKEISLKLIKQLPEILKFEADNPFVLPNTHISLKWSVKNAIITEIDNGIGDVTNLNTIDRIIEKPERFTLKATNQFGSVYSKSIKVATLNLKMPTSFSIPTPEFNQQINFPTIKDIDQILSSNVGIEFTEKINRNPT